MNEWWTAMAVAWATGYCFGSMSMLAAILLWVAIARAGDLEEGGKSESGA